MDEMRQKLENLKSAHERMPADLTRFDQTKKENQAFLSLNDIQETKKEVELIDKYLFGGYTDEELLNMDQSIQLTSEEKMTLSNKMSMDLGHILLNEHSKEDSPEMTDVKEDVINLAKAIEQVKNEPLDMESMDVVETAFRMLTNSCKNYLDKKNPHFKKGKIRKQMVHDLWVSVLYEAEMFNLCRNMLRPDYEGQRPATIGELLGLNKETEINRPEEMVEPELNQLYDNFNIQREKSDKKDEKGKKEKKPAEPQLSAEGKFLSDTVFAKGFVFSKDIKEKYSSESSQKAKAADVLKLLEEVKTIPVGAVVVKDLVLMGKPIKLLQKSDNSLWLIENHVPIRLEKNLSTLRNQIELDIVNNDKLYGKNAVSNIIAEHRGMELKKAVTSGEHTRIRTLLAAFLAKHTKLAENEFDNIFKSQMMDYADALIAGTKTPVEIKNEVLEYSKNNLFVNGVGISEMVEINKKQKTIDEIAAAVKLNTTEEIEIIEEGWSEEEKQVKNVIADLIFTNDTAKMDISVEHPDQFIADMIKQHEGAIKALVKAKGEGKDLVKDILKKMSISELEGTLDGKKVNLGSVVAEVINGIADLYEKSPEGNLSKDDLIDLKKKLDTVVDQSLQIMQSNVDVMTGVIFPDQPEAEENTKVKKPIRQVVADTSKSQKGQGKFMRNVMKTYFAGVSNIDKRAMLASVFRYAKNVPPLRMSDQEIVDEIKERKLKKYEGLFTTTKKDKEGQVVLDLTSQDKAAILEYKEEKQILRIQANFMGGLFRGAGPLMQKMLQGLSTTGLPVEIKEALSDMKSNLPPIPDKIVQTQLLSMVESSGGMVTKIEVEKSLGAASVGQAFLCKVYGPSRELKNGKQVVIKLLRTEASNRMMREEKIMLKAAEDTDKAMFLTYKGQLQNYKNELNLNIEAQNCRDGLKYYSKTKKKGFDDVKSMTLFETIPATSTTMAIDKAEGVTLDSYIDELAKYADKELDELYVKKENSDGSIEVNKTIYFNTDPEYLKKLEEKKKALVDKVNEAVKRRDHIIHLCHVWVDEAMMRRQDRFYHGDLHAGNIMINDKEATFIDFGNAVTLTDAQQTCITQMAVAATGSVVSNVTDDSVDLFFEAFNNLITENNDPEFLAIYDDAKKQELKKAFGEVLKQGEANEAGFRIVLCLQKAQELGIKIPAAIYSFAQGQTRLQNSIDEMNAAIDKMKAGIDKIDNIRVKSSPYADGLKTLMNKIQMDFSTGTVKEKVKKYLESIMPVDKEKFIAELKDNTVIYEDVEEGIKGEDREYNFRIKYVESYRPLLKIKSIELYKMGMSKETLKKLGRKDVDDIPDDTKTFRQEAQEFFRTMEGKANSKEMDMVAMDASLKCLPVDAIGESLLDAFGGADYLGTVLYPHFLTLNWDGVDEVLRLFENQVTNALLMFDASEKYFSERKDEKKKITPEREKELCNQVYEHFNAIHEDKAKSSDILTSSVTSKMDLPSYEDNIEKDLSNMIKEKTDGLGAKLEKAFNEYKRIKKKYPVEMGEDGHVLGWHVGEEDKKAYEKAKKDFAEYYGKICFIQIKGYLEKVLDKEASVKYVDYDKVLGDVIMSQMGKSKLAMGLNITRLTKWLGMKTMTVASKMMGF